MKQDLSQEPIQLQDNYCETIEEMINSKDFLRVFGIVLKSLKKYDVDYFSNILEKIQKYENLSEKEKSDIIELLSSKAFKEKAEEVSDRLVGFTKAEFEKFFEDYSVKNLINETKKRANKETLKLTNGTEEEKNPVFIENSYEIGGEKYNVLSINIDGKEKRCIKKDGAKVEEKDFIFDDILPLIVNGKVYYQARVSNKKGYIEPGKEDEYEEKIIFDDIGELEKINGKIYYGAMIGNKWSYIEFGKENKYEEKIIFDDIGSLQEINGKIYYYAKIGDKWGYIELGKENEYEEKVIFNYVGDLEEINGKIYYYAKIGDKWGYIELGKENERKLVTMEKIMKGNKIRSKYGIKIL